MTHAAPDQAGSTGCVSGFGVGRGGTPGGTVSHAARRTVIAISRAVGPFKIFCTFTPSLCGTGYFLNHREILPTSPCGGGTQPGFRKS